MITFHWVFHEHKLLQRFFCLFLDLLLKSSLNKVLPVSQGTKVIKIIVTLEQKLFMRIKKINKRNHNARTVLASVCNSLAYTALSNRSLSSVMLKQVHRTLVMEVGRHCRFGGKKTKPIWVACATLTQVGHHIGYQWMPQTHLFLVSMLNIFNSTCYKSSHILFGFLACLPTCNLVGQQVKLLVTIRKNTSKLAVENWLIICWECWVFFNL